MKRHRAQPPFFPLIISLCLIAAASCSADTSALGSFTFCYGLERGGNPQVFQNLGLNTLYIDLLPADIADLQPCRQMIRSAHELGLKVIVGLPTCLTPAYRVSPYDTKYTGSVSELIECIVGALRDEPGITAWATGHALEKSISYTDADFRRYLEEGYPTLDDLNASWGVQLPTWMSITMKDARDADAQVSFKVGRASVDLSDYQARAYHDIMDAWQRAVHAVDATRPLFTGRVTLYRSLVSIPDGYNVVCVSMPPDVVESDMIAHNLQALDIARRGGKFRVLQTLRVPAIGSLPYNSDSMRPWIQQAALHGSAGYGLEDWALLSDIYAGEARMLPRARRLTNAITACRDLSFDFVPRASSALVYSPYAAGLEVTGQPLYGYLREYLAGEPSNLMYSLRMGTRYGVMDYLAPQDLSTSDLSRYGALLLPACLRLPERPQADVVDYVERGGVVLADLGLGMYETGAWDRLPDPLMRLFGLLQMGNLKDRAADLTVSTPLPGLPLPRALQSKGTFNAGSGKTGAATERKSFTVGGPTAEVQLAADAVPVATGSVRFDKDKSPIFTGLMGRRSGSGMGLFATHPLWQHWPLGDPLSTSLHGHLLARRARYELVQSGLLSGTLQMAASDNEICLLNLDKQPASASVWAYAAASHPYCSAISSFSANPLQQGLPSGTALVVAAVPGFGMSRLLQTALVVQPYADDATVEMREYSPQRLVFRLSGPGAVVTGSPGRGLEVHGGTDVSARLILSSGRYPVAPRSRHRVTLRTRGGQESSEVLMANERGELDLSGVYRQDTCTIIPAP